MLAVDTNVVVRYVTRDHPEQSPRAKALIDGNDVLLATTVLLETEWVLRSAYGFDRAEIVEALRSLAGLPRLTLENPARALKALDWFTAGMDFADALHLAGTEHCEAFVSFDRSLIRRARQYARMPVRPP